MNLRGRRVTLHDMCLRDGMHAKAHQLTLEQMVVPDATWINKNRSALIGRWNKWMQQ